MLRPFTLELHEVGLLRYIYFSVIFSVQFKMIIVLLSRCSSANKSPDRYQSKTIELYLLVLPLLLAWNTLSKMINSAVGGGKRLRSEVRYRNDSSSYSACTSLLIRPTMIYNRKQRYWQRSGWAQGNTLWMNPDPCQCVLLSISHCCVSCVAAETDLSSPFARPPGDAEGETAFAQRSDKEPCLPRPEALCESMVSGVSHSAGYNLGFIDLCVVPHINAGQCCCSLFIRWWLLIPLHYWIS